MAGRKPKPTALKVLQGNPGHRPLPKDEPKPTRGKVTCPKWVKGQARAEWNRVAPELQRTGVLTVIDRAALVAYCQAWGRMVDAQRWIDENGTTIVMRDKDGRVKSVIKAPQVTIARDAAAEMRAFATDLGLTPSSRTRLHVEPPTEESAFEAFLNDASHTS